MNAKRDNTGLYMVLALLALFVLAFAAMTYRALTLEQEVYSLTVQHVTCDGLSLTIESDKTEAREFLTRNCDAWSTAPVQVASR